MSLLLIGGVLAGEVTGARLFNADDHARLLIIYAGERANVRTRSLPPFGQNPARSIVLVDGVSVGSLQGSTVNEHGLIAMDASDMNGDAQVSLLFQKERVLEVTHIMDGAFVVDMVTVGGQEDPELPDIQQLRAWLEGTAFTPREGDQPNGRRLIVVDPGHGGVDHGAVGVSGTREADIALQIAKRVARGLEEKLGAEVILTREEDVFVSLRERAAIANQNGAELFLSIHANAAPGPAAWGIETYSIDTPSDASANRVARRENTFANEHGHSEENVLRGRMLSDASNQRSRSLSVRVHTDTVEHLQKIYGEDQVKDLGSKTAGFYVLASTRMPAILLETSFVSNPDDERKLRTPHFQQNMADAIVGAVGAWLEDDEQ